MSSSDSLMTMTYSDGPRGISLNTYADTVVYDTFGGKKTLCAVRFGGYPEQVDGMMMAIYLIELFVICNFFRLHFIILQISIFLS